MNNKNLKLRQLATGATLILLAGCQNEANQSAPDAELLEGADVMREPIRYGQLTPTLYPELTQGQNHL